MTPKCVLVSIGFISFHICRHVIGKEKGEVFRKSLSCVPSYESEEEEDVLGGDSENHKTVKQGKTRGGNSENETPRRSKKECRKKVLKITL